MYAVTIYTKDGGEYPHGGDSWQTPSVDDLPISSGKYGMEYQYMVSNAEGDVVGTWYSDSSEEAISLPLAAN